MANNRLAFGLCKKYGIDLPDNATPEDAWEALKEKGVENVDEKKNDVELDVAGSDYPQRARFSSLPEVKLSPKEYKMVMSELATHLTREEYNQPTVTKHIGNHTYRVEILGFGNYRIVGKMEIPTRRRRK